MNKRLLMISEILLKENNYITINSVASNLGVSNKTIRNDLLTLETLLKDYNLSLDKKTGSGVIIVGDDNIKLSLLSTIKNKLNSVIAYSPEDRCTYILKKILSSDANTRICNLSSTLHVSSATIYKDLVLVENWLKKYKITLLKESYLGIKAVGKEKNIRKALGDLIFENKDYTYLSNLIYNKKSEIHTLPSIKLFEDILSIDFNNLKDILLSVHELELHRLPHESFLSLLIQVSISINRVSQGKYIGLTDSTNNYFKSKDNYIYVKQLCDEISKDYNINYPDFEISYISMILLAQNIPYNSISSNIDNDLNTNYIPDPRDIAVSLIQKWEDILNIPISKDNRLLTSLTLHLSPAIYRLRFSLPINNPILNEIKQNYPNTFEVAQTSSDIFKSYLDCTVSEYEIGYLTMHLANAINRYKKTLRTILVSHSSVGISELLYSKIKDKFNELQIVSCQSLTLLSNSDLDNIDLVITTTPILNELGCDTITVNPLLKDEDLSRLNILIKKLHSKKNNDIYPF